MGLFDLFGNKKQELLELQKLVLDNSPDKLIMSEKQLKDLATKAAARDLEIIQDCIRIVGSTTKPDTFFSRLALLIDKADNLRKYEKFISFKGASPSEAYGQLWSDYQESIQRFLIRYFSDVFDQAEKLKTDNGKLNKYQKFYDSLQPYYSQMSADHIDYIETKYKAYTNLLK